MYFECHLASPSLLINVSLLDDRRPGTFNFKMAGTSGIHRNVLGIDLSRCVENAKVLVVGAGGIGCELLKNLVLTGFKDIEVVSKVNVFFVTGGDCLNLTFVPMKTCTTP